VSAILSVVGISFVEKPGMGLDVTTVFFASPKLNEYLAVDSRHGKVVGSHIAEQYYGTCKVIQ
jgi:hypothetical protein